MPKKTVKTKRPYKQKEAKLFALWCSIPAVLFALFREQPHKLKTLGYDIEDKSKDGLAVLLECRSRSAFARKFDIDIDTLYVWSRSESHKKWVEEYNHECNVMKFKKDIDFNFTQKTIMHSDAARVKLWKQLYEGWIEKSKQEFGDNVQPFNITIVQDPQKKEPKKDKKKSKK